MNFFGSKDAKNLGGLNTKNKTEMEIENAREEHLRV